MSGYTALRREEQTEGVFDFGISVYSEIVKSPAFVDKTMFIKTLFSESSMVLISAPRRFGKSTNMHMLKTFLEIQVGENGQVIEPKASTNYNIFKNNNLLIFQQVEFFEKHFGRYPVIHVDFKSVAGESFSDIVDRFRTVLYKVFQEHGYLLISDKLNKTAKEKFNLYYDHMKYKMLSRSEIIDGLEYLSKCLYTHFNRRVFVLIDEYDAPINNALFETQIDIKEVNKLLCAIFSNTLKSNQYVCRALLTGISYFATVGLSGANNIEKFMFLGDHPFVQFYGLTETEVNNLLKKFSINEQNCNLVKLHYNGYSSLSRIKLYSLWSILHYLKYRCIKSYWQQSGVLERFKEVLLIPIIKYSIEILLQTEGIYKCRILNTIELDDVVQLKKVLLESTDSQQLSLRDPSLYISFLLQQGYITYVREVSDEVFELKIPNFEVAKEFKKHISSFYDESLNESINSCANVINELSSNSEKTKFRQFAKSFQKVIEALDDKFVKNNEDTFHCLLFNILCRSQYSIGTEFSFHNGRPDLILYRGTIGAIFELKYKKSSTEALRQIIDKKYFDVFKTKPCFDKIEERIYMGINVGTILDVNISYLCNSTNLHQAEDI